MTKELIAEARAWAPCAMSPTGQLKLITRLADALEAAARVPVQGEPNGDREALARVLYIASDDFAFADRMAKAWDAPGAHGRQRWYRYADAILTAGFSRAVVPDAATERQGGRIVNSLREAVRGERDGTTIPVPVEDCREIIAWRAERDAAVAAVERVRAIHPNVNGECHTCSNENGPKSWPCPTVAALDGAPEPEWEYGVSVEGLDGGPEPRFTRDAVQHVIDHPDLYRKWTQGNPAIMHRRTPAGPWLPVEGERP